MNVHHLISRVRALGVSLFLRDGDLAFKAKKDALTDELKSEIRAHKSAIVAYLKKLEGGLPAVRARNLNEGPLSFAQRSIWFNDAISPGGNQYHVPLVLELRGRLDFDALSGAFAKIMERHQILRTVIQLDASQNPVQRVCENCPVDIPRNKIKQFDTGIEAIYDEVLAEINKPFDLAKGPALRMKLLEAGAEHYYLIIVLHHIASDAWSQGILTAEFTQFYTELTKTKAGLTGLKADTESNTNRAQTNSGARAALPLQYLDYALWQKEVYESGILSDQFEFWAQRLAGIPELHGLPLDRSRSAQRESIGDRVKQVFNETTTRRLYQLVGNTDTTLFMVLQSVFAVLLSTYSNATDIVVGTPVANRHQAELSNLIGCFVNMLVIRTDLSAQPTFSQLLKQTREYLLSAFENQQIPFEKLVDHLNIERSASHTPIFQIVFVLHHNDNQPVALPGLSLDSVELPETQVKFDLTLRAVEENSNLYLYWEYATALFDRATIEQMSAHFGALLGGILENPDTSIDSYPLLSATEEKQQLFDWNAEKKAYPAKHCIHELFERQAARGPDRIAVSCGDQQMSYQALNQRANQIAHFLLENGVKPDELVGLSVNRSVDMIVGVLAILKAGGAYVPLDPHLPDDRIGYILDDSALRVVLVQQKNTAKNRYRNRLLVAIDTHTPFADYPDHNVCGRQRGLTPSNLAYAIYTSGSTGKPKGVLIEHRNVVRLFHAAEFGFDFGQSDVWTQFHSIAFDFSVWEVWGALIHGARLLIVPYWITRSMDEFYSLVVREGVTVLNQTPSSFNQFIAEDLLQRGALALRYVIFGGEALVASALTPWFLRHGDSSPQLINMYGITETTVHTTYCPLKKSLPQSPGAHSLIGRPLSDLNVLVLDSRARLVPVGVCGELYIRGDGVARGYLNRPQLTAEKFVENPLGQKMPGRFYKSGDLVRWSRDGQLAYVGRIDSQVKIRGFRIELGEIEANLLTHSAVEQAVALSKGTPPRLIAYIVAPGIIANTSPDKSADTGAFFESLRAHLGQSLPEYMIPSAFSLLSEIPLTPNGKLNHRALPAVDFTAQEQQAYAPPSTYVERILCDVWQTVLGRAKIGVHANFFNLGGDSILSLQVVSLARQKGIDISVKDIFSAQTISGLSRLVAAQPETAPALETVAAFSLLSDAEKTSLERYLGGPLSERPLLEDAYPLSTLQQGMIFHNELSRDAGIYHDIMSYCLTERWSEKSFRHALQKLLQDNQLLRSIVYYAEERPLHLIYREMDLPLTVRDLRHYNERDRREILARWMETEKTSAFERNKPLWSVVVFRLTEQRFQYCLVCHHALLDGWSVASLNTVLFQWYRLGLAGEALPDRPSLPYCYFIAQELRSLHSTEAETYWKTRLAAAELPWWTGKERTNSVRRDWQLSIEQAYALNQLSEQLGVSVKSLLLTIHLVLLSILNGNKLVVSSIVCNGRLELDGGDRTLGLFLNSLPLCLSGDASNWVALIRRVSLAEAELYEHRHYPLAEVQRLGGQDLSAALFNYVNFHVLDSIESEIDVVSADMFTETNYLYALSCSKVSRINSYCFTLTADAGLFDPVYMQRIEVYFFGVLRELIAAPEKPLHYNQFLPPRERENLIRGWNNTGAAFPDSSCIHELFEHQVDQFPDAIALYFDGGDLSARAASDADGKPIPEQGGGCAAKPGITYRDLNERANRLAHWLLEKGVGTQMPVGLCVERSVEMLVGILAILKAGGVYVATDAGSPAQRLRDIFADSGAKFVLTQRQTAESLCAEEHIADRANCLIEMLCIDNAASYAHCPATNIDKHVLPLSADDPAYIVYTSGSTGKPKGSLLKHRGLCNLAKFQGQYFAITGGANVLQFASMAFDAATSEWAMALCNGAAMTLIPAQATRDPEILGQYVSHYRVTHATLPPALLSCLDSHQWRCVKHITVAGEACPVELAREWARGRNFYNAYGPSEATVCSTVYRYQGSEASLPIGTPIANTHVFVLDRKQQLVAPGVAGELYIAGIGLSAGYLNRPALNREKFVANPYSGKAGEQLFRTGDRVRWTSGFSGNGAVLEFLGRVDKQVKVRGHRVEPGEIENRLLSAPSVTQALVIKQEDRDSLTAYLVVANRNDIQETDFIRRLRQHLEERLPDYMVPGAFVLLEKFPLTTNGKIDVAALPIVGESLAGDSEYEAPATAMEKQLCQIWQELLGVKEIGIGSHFFASGGHSLLAMRLAAKIRVRFGVDIAVKSLFTAHTVRAMSKLIQAKLAEVGSSRQSAPVRGEDSLNRETDNEFPALSFSQERLWLIDKIEPGSAQYNMPMALCIEGELNIAVLKRVFETLIARHPALRTTIVCKADGEPFQRVLGDYRFQLTQVDLSGLAKPDRDRQLEELVGAEAGRGFDLERDLMLRVTLVKLSEQEHALLMTVHHIASDGWSQGILVKEFSHLYQSYLENRQESLPALPLQYTDFAVWERKRLRGENYQRHLAFWTSYLAGIPAVHSLPLDRERTTGSVAAETITINKKATNKKAINKKATNKKATGKTLTQLLSNETLAALYKLAHAHNATLFTVIQTLFAVTLARHANSDEFVMGTPIANRERDEFSGIVGFFANTVVLRTKIGDNPAFSELLRRNQDAMLAVYEHQQYPFEQLVDTLQPSRNMNYTPLFQVMLVLQNNEVGELHLPGLNISNIAAQSSNAKFDLTLTVTEGPASACSKNPATENSGLFLQWEYVTALFDVSTIAKLAAHLEILLNTFIKNPKTGVCEACLVTPDEKDALLNQWHSNATPFIETGSPAELFRLHAGKHAGKTALIAGGQRLTYGELDRKSDQLASYLVSVLPALLDRGEQPIVGVALERSPDLIISILALFKAGAVYLPLDPRLPRERLDYILGDSRASVVITDTEFMQRFDKEAYQLLALDGFSYSSAAGSMAVSPVVKLSQRNPHTSQANDLAYVIYTSGTTGRPKGVLIENHGVVNLALSLREKLALDPDKSWGWLASTVFDASIQGISQLMLGTCLSILSDDEKFDVILLKQRVVRDNIGVIDCTPSLAELWLEQGSIDDLPRLVVGGEAISRTLWKKLADRPCAGKKSLNVYGPTECTVNSTWAVIEGDTPTIGTLLPNTGALVLNRFEQLVPQGSVGELCIGGSGLARGYLNKPDLTATKFIRHPFLYNKANNKADKLYKTGDLVRQLPDGNLVFIGRADDQIKLNGYRIELGEIQSQLDALDAVAASLVTVRTDATQHRRLVAYVIPAQGQTLSEKNIRRHLEKHLPDYMVPAAILFIDQWPLNPNGKIDKSALPAPARETVESEQEEARSPIERKLLEIWAAVLNLDAGQLDISSNFFALGGNSLLAVRLTTAIRTRLQMEIAVRQIFEHPTIEKLSQALEKGGVAALSPIISPVDKSGPLPLSFAQQRMWMIDRFQAGSPNYNMPAAFIIEGDFSEEITRRVIRTIVARHEILRTRYCASDTGAVQEISANPRLPFSVFDLQQVPVAEQNREVRKIVLQDANQPFDLARDIPLRVKWIVLNETDSRVRVVLLLNMHHIAGDAWSTKILFEEFSTLYQSHRQGLASPLSPLPIQYADYAVWQRQYLKGLMLDKQLSFWKRQLDSVPPRHSLPLDFERPDQPPVQGQSLVGEISPPVTVKLKALAEQASMTPFMVLHAALSLLLSRHSCSRDIIIGTPVANRTQPGLESLIGFFVNMLVLRSNVDQSATATDLLHHIKNVNLDAQSNQELPFEYLVEKLSVPRDNRHAPLVQIILTFNSMASGSLAIEDASIQPYAVDYTPLKFDLELHASDSDGGLQLNWVYDRSLFKRETVERFNQHFIRLLTAIVEKPQVPLCKLEMQSEWEIQNLVGGISEAASHYPSDLTLQALFSERAKAVPNNPALEFCGRKMTYQTLDTLSNQLAHYLREQGLQAQQLVGIAMESGFEQILAALATLKAGAAFVSLNCHPSQSQLDDIQNEGGVTLLLTQSAYGEWPEASGRLCIALDCLWEELRYYSTAPVPRLNLDSGQPASAGLAYVTYSADAAGVMVEHKSIVNLVLSQRRQFGLDQHSRVLHSAALAAHTAIWNWSMALCAGACLYIIDRQTTFAPEQLGSYVNRHRITYGFLPPTLLQRLNLPDFGPIKTLVVGGEAVPLEQLQKWSPGRDLFTVYGAAECTSVAAVAKLTGPITASVGQVVMGKAIDNTVGLVLDAHLNLVPLGCVGELYVGGAGVARGYLNRRELTEKRFLTLTLGGRRVRLYRSGDRVRYTAGGDLVFLGREEALAKVKGMGVDLNAIGARVAASQYVESCRVIAGAEAPPIAYVKLNPFGANPESAATGEDITVAIKAELREAFPDAMGSAAANIAIVIVDDWPLTADGCLDTAALPAPPSAVGGDEHIAAVSATEKQLVRVWRVLLNLNRDDISVTDSFFTLGGHSLLIVRLQQEIKSLFNVEVPLHILIKSPTIRRLGHWLDHNPKPARDRTQDPHLIQLLAGSKADLAPLFLLHPIGGSLTCYAELIARLSPERSIYGLQASLDEYRSIERIADRYLRSLAACHSSEPIVLCGWSVGGVIAFEMACQLKAKGIDSNLILIDSACPTSTGLDVIASPDPSGQTSLRHEIVATMALELGIDLSGLESDYLRRTENFTARELLSQLLRVGIEQGCLVSGTGPDSLERIYRTIEILMDAVRAFKPGPYAGSLTWLRARETQATGAAADWPGLAEQVHVDVIPGDHHSMIREPRVRFLAEALERTINDYINSNGAGNTG